jgi:hypothetical protein
VVSVVAEELSKVFEKIAEVTGVALANESFTGGAGGTTVKTNSGLADPPPGGGLVTPMEKLPPNCSNVCESVAVI